MSTMPRLGIDTGTLALGVGLVDGAVCFLGKFIGTIVDGMGTSSISDALLLSSSSSSLLELLLESSPLEDSDKSPAVFFT